MNESPAIKHLPGIAGRGVVAEDGRGWIVDVNDEGSRPPTRQAMLGDELIYHL